MKYITHIIRLFVGVVFIISGFVKLIDPLGFSFKLEEYFAPDVLNMPFFEPFALPIAIFVATFELVLGVLLLLGYQKNWTLWSLIISTVFFGFLTFYSAYFNKVTDCGCFGDAIKFTPWQSFIKDMVLFALVLVLFFLRKNISPICADGLSKAISATVVVGCGAFVYYTLNHLPIIDFRAYKIGTNIEEGMKIPADAPKAVYNYFWIFRDKQGKEHTLVTQGDYPDFDGEFVGTKPAELVSKGYTPPIHDFTIEKDGEDYTAEMLAEPRLLLITAYNLKRAHLEGFTPIKELSDKALQAGYKVIGVTSSIDIAEQIEKKYELNFSFYFTDMTTLKTIIRSNPGIVVLEKGTIMQKANYNDALNIKL